VKISALALVSRTDEALAAIELLRALEPIASIRSISVGFEGLSGNRMLDQSITGFGPKRRTLTVLARAPARLCS
jgi:hypothetical protein